MDGGGAERSSRGLSKSCVILIVIGGVERFVFKGVASNLVTYLTDTVGMTNSSAAKMVNSWCGFTSIMPLLLAPLADSYWDRFSTILLSAFLYLLGLVALTWTALVGTGASSLLLFWSLCVVSVGQGGYNPSLQALGTDQLESPNPAYFRMWYMGICSGSLLGITLMSYIQDTFGWVIGFAIPTLTMLASILVFLCATPLIIYIRRQDTHNPIQTIVNIIKAAATRLKTGRITLPDDNSHVVELELEEKPLCSSGESVDKESSEMLLGEDKNYKVILRLLPIWTMLLMFAVIFQQPPTFFTKQGMTMERSIGGGGLKIPPATLQSAITVSIILLMPLYDVLIVPFARLITGDDRGLSVMQRMGVGMFLSIVSMLFAALVETKRLETSRDKSGPLSILWLLPQYIVLGMADTFTVVGMQEFFYSEVPIRMRTMGFALYTSVFGMGSFLSAILISLLEIVTTSAGGHNWFSNDMTKARLDRYYWLLATLSTLSLLFYAILCKYHKTRSQLHSQDTASTIS